MSKTTRPPAPFKGRTHDELRDGAAMLPRRADEAAQLHERRRPTREEVAARVDHAQQLSQERLASIAASGLSAMLNADAGAIGFRPAERMALHFILASDDLA